MNAPALSRREKIFDLEQAMRAMPEHQVDLEPRHHFADGIYVRELYIPAGTALVGKVHKTEHVCMLLKGRIVVATDDGERVIEAPAIVVSPAGTKRAGYALEDCIWVNVHPTSERDLSKIEQQFIEPEPLHALEQEERACLG